MVMEEKLRMTIVVPCFNEQESIRLFHDEVERTFCSGPLSELDHNILFVNDGSSDDTLLIIKQLAKNSDKIEYISLSRNFGKEAAIFAGLENSTGDFVALMDADLQDPPNLLEKMFLTIVNEGFDCVATKRSSRKGEPLIRSWFAMFFYKIINSISKINLVDGARDFRLMTRQMVDSIVSLREYNRFSKGLFSWVGFNVKWIEYENIERIAGKTKWSFWGLFLYSVDGIIAFSAVPLALSSFLGVLISFFSLLGIIFIVVKTVIFGDPVTGWPSLVTIVSFIGGLQLLCLGIIGQYLAKTYMETKDRPIYILKETSLKK
jgi:glycosyltransferase involved in cell wall biosynthesis